MDKVQNKILETITSLNKSWTSSRSIDELENYFHSNIIALVSQEKKKIIGKNACAAYWKSCSENIIIHKWSEYDFEIQVYGDGKFAIVSYKFEFSVGSILLN